MIENNRYHVYVLKSLKNGKKYVGFTSLKVNERLTQHNHGSNQWTRQNRPFELIHSESFSIKLDAQKREKFLKSGVGRKYLSEHLIRHKNQLPP